MSTLDVSQMARTAVAASSPGFVSAFVACPFDVVKTRLQTSPAGHFSGPVGCLWWTLKRENPLSLWRGVSPLLLSATPYTMILFTSYQALRPDDGNPAGCFCAGALAGAALTLPQNPLEVWRVRLQALEGDRSKVLRSLMAQPRLLFRGASMTAVVNVPGNGIMFLTNETLRAKFQRHSNFGLHHVVANSVTGALTGIIFKLCIYPADLLRSRLMVAGSSGNAVTLMKNLVRDGGLSALYAGASVVVVRACATNAIVWPVFYWCRQHLAC